MRLMRHHAGFGFTLLELMFVVAVMAILSGTVLTTFLCLNRVATTMTDYRTAHAGARYALTVISDDVRKARSVAVSSVGSYRLTVQGAEASPSIRYILDKGVLSRSDGAPARFLCAGVAGMRVDLLRGEGAPASDGSSVALVRTTLNVLEARRGTRATNTFSLVAAMRNRGSP